MLIRWVGGFEFENRYRRSSNCNYCIFSSQPFVADRPYIFIPCSCLSPFDKKAKFVES
jgi:hypothetical protein